MDIVASIIKALFGSKADKDRKQIEPFFNLVSNYLIYKRKHIWKH